MGCGKAGGTPAWPPCAEGRDGGRAGLSGWDGRPGHSLRVEKQLRAREPAGGGGCTTQARRPRSVRGWEERSGQIWDLF